MALAISTRIGQCSLLWSAGSHRASFNTQDQPVIISAWIFYSCTTCSCPSWFISCSGQSFYGSLKAWAASHQMVEPFTRDLPLLSHPVLPHIRASAIHICHWMLQGGIYNLMGWVCQWAIAEWERCSSICNSVFEFLAAFSHVFVQPVTGREVPCTLGQLQQGSCQLFDYDPHAGGWEPVKWWSSHRHFLPVPLRRG